MSDQNQDQTPNLERTRAIRREINALLDEWEKLTLKSELVAELEGLARQFVVQPTQANFNAWYDATDLLDDLTILNEASEDDHLVERCAGSGAEMIDDDLHVAVIDAFDRMNGVEWTEPFAGVV